MLILQLMNLKETTKALQKIYFLQLIPALVLLITAYLFQLFFPLHPNSPAAGKTVSVIITTLAGVMGIALPVFYRSYFVYKIKDQKQISNERFMVFERTLLTLALITPYFLTIAILMNMNQTVLMLITLFSIYVIYYFYPSEKKVRFEMKIFRIKPND